MYTRLLLALVFIMLFGTVGRANDDWGWDWNETDSVERTNHSSHDHADGDGSLLPLHSLSLATHGAYFGSGNEFLPGGANVLGFGGSRHSADHNINHPTFGVYPEIQHLFGNEVGFLGPMWGAPTGFAPGQSAKGDGQASGDQPGSPIDGGFSFSVKDYDDADWWAE